MSERAKLRGPDPYAHDETWRQEQLRLLEIEQKLAEAGITIDELIDLIDARRAGRY